MLLCLLILRFVCFTFSISVDPCPLNRRTWIDTLTRKFNESCTDFSVSMRYEGWLEHLGYAFGAGWKDRKNNGEQNTERVRVLDLDHSPCSKDPELTASILLSEIKKKNDKINRDTCAMFRNMKTFACVPLKLPTKVPGKDYYTYSVMVYCSFTGEKHNAFNIPKLVATWE